MNLSDQDRIARVGLFSAMIVGSALTLYFSRGLTFSLDEVVWFAESPHLDLKSALEPHAGILAKLAVSLTITALHELGGRDGRQA